MKTTIITLFFTISTIIVFSQQQKKINADTSWNGHMCNGGHGMCYIDSSINKSTSNTQISFNKENRELTFILSKLTLDETNKLKLLSSKLEKDFYLYTFDVDFLLPTELKKALNIKELSKIKQGNYLIRVIKDQIIMKLKLE